MKRSLMKRMPFKASASITKKAAPSPRAKLTTKQRTRTPSEIELHDQLAGLGCIACIKDGRYQPYVSIHHVDGRTKPDCHKLVLPLCAGHHQDGTGEDKTLIAVHPWKARFEKRYGSQMALVVECMNLIGETLCK